MKLSLATLCQTNSSVSDAAGPAVASMIQALWRTGYVQMDLTPVQFLSWEHNGGIFMEQMWISVVVGGDGIYIRDISGGRTPRSRVIPRPAAVRRRQ